MNRRKTGRPYEFPNPFVGFLVAVKVGLDVPYRTMEGITGEQAKQLRQVQKTHCAHMRRILASVEGMELELPEGEEFMTVIADSTGFSLSKSTYIKDKWEREGGSI